MAKNSTKAATAAAPANGSDAGDEGLVSGLAFQIEEGIPLPAITRGAPAGRGPSPYATAMSALKLADDPARYQSFFIPADVPATITDEDEKKKALTEATRKISNRISGIARRMSGKDATVAFAIRTMVNAAGVTGVRVYRVKAEPKAPRAPKAPAPVPATPPPAPQATAAS